MQIVQAAVAVSGLAFKQSPLYTLLRPGAAALRMLCNGLSSLSPLPSPPLTLLHTATGGGLPSSRLAAHAQRCHLLADSRSSHHAPRDCIWSARASSYPGSASITRDTRLSLSPRNCGPLT